MKRICPACHLRLALEMLRPFLDVPDVAPLRREGSHERSLQFDSQGVDHLILCGKIERQKSGASFLGARLRTKTSEALIGGLAYLVGQRVARGYNLSIGGRGRDWSTGSFRPFAFVDNKSRVVKWKHGRDGKRADKRNCRSTAKNKLDSFIPRAGSTGSSSTVAGNNILGLYGLKSEVHDISKYMSDMSLKALVNGSCKSGEVSKFKMKQSSNANENILLSVKEACAILAPTLQSGATDGFDTRCDGKAHLSPLTCGLQAAHENDFDVKSEAKEASSSEGKELFDHSEALHTLMYNLQLCEPQEFLQRLALPQVKTLDSLLSQAPTTADFQRVPDQFSGVPTSLGASLPPFPWSLTPNVTCKPSSDPNKSSANKNTFQRRWIRIGANNKCSSHLDSKPCERIGVSSKLQIVDGPIEVSDGVIKCTPSSQIFDQIDQNEGLNTSSSCDPSDACFAERHLNSWNNPYSTSCWNKHFHFGANDSHDMKNHHGNEQFCMGKGSISQKIENIFLSTSKSKLPKPEYTHGASTSPSKFAADGCDLGPDKNSKHVYRDVGHSPRLVAAAETLYEIASCSKCSSGKQIQSHGSRRLPSKQQPKAMKAPKSRPSTVKDEACTAKAKPLKVKPATHPNKKTGKASLYPNEESNNKRTMTLVSDLHLRGPIKWPVPKYPLKLEANAKSLNMEFGNLLALLPSTSSGNQNFNNPPQKLKKVVVHVGPQSKDMARGRSKKD
ncbi:hypothetical protein AMTR_s00159p00049090 [Amborella trichopoda]|uniref:Uncharacterized protein n=1 Tax=Amborella trichopoda TaxID=13333 RepID=W1PQ03_AMBTC|nr:hypothetical protein AMTR_s00159p00049090 [Amborella trichopoda]